MSKKYPGGFVTNLGTVGNSVFFDGTGDYLTVPSNAAFAFGTGDFTVEFWLYMSSSASYGYIVQCNDFANGFWVYRDTGTTKVIVGIGASDLFTQTSTPSLNTWNHYAVVRQGTTVRLYYNGVSNGSGTSAASVNAGTCWISTYNALGFFFNGYVSNFRIIKGTALYTAAFTPPTQLLNVTNTSLLTCNSPAIVDQSSNNFAITVNGNAAVSTFTPFPVVNPAPTTSSALAPAPGIWTLDQALQYTQQGVWPSYATNAIEDVFSTWLYTGNNSAQTITNGIDLSGKGGLVWIKNRTTNSTHGGAHQLVDTARGLTGASGSSMLSTNNTDPASGAQAGGTAGNQGFSSFSSSGFNLSSVGGSVYSGSTNTNAVSYTSWTFRKQPKFFDVVTYTGNGVARSIAHSLDSVPGCIIIKRTDVAGEWRVWHRALPSPNTELLYLNRTDASASIPVWSATSPTATDFYLSTASATNASGGTFVAYLFAHNAGGFGSSGNDNVVSCGSFTYTAGTTINLGYEPQWLLVKRTDAAQDWFLVDVLRGWTTDSTSSWLLPNTSDNESAPSALGLAPTATGFRVPTGLGNGSPYIYIAIRRGPMRPPSTGTSVFSPVAYNGTNSAGQVISGVGFSPDLTIPKYRAGSGGGAVAMFIDRLRGGTAYLAPSSTAAEGNTAGYYVRSFDMDGTTFGTAYVDYTNSANTYVDWFFRRAPGFFDEVCYTGNGIAGRTINHNLAVVPEMMIVKPRNDPYSVPSENFWTVYHVALGNTQRLRLNSDIATQATSTGAWNNTTPTASVFSVGNSRNVNFDSATTYVAYLFATVPGVSKVGSYTGTGTTQVINCGFTAGSRFVMIKRTDSTGDWYVWDSARGIVAGNDPYLLMNSTAAEVTNTDYVDTAATGFEISSTAPAAINANGGTFIFLAIA